MVYGCWWSCLVDITMDGMGKREVGGKKDVVVEDVQEPPSLIRAPMSRSSSLVCESQKLVRKSRNGLERNGALTLVCSFGSTVARKKKRKKASDSSSWRILSLPPCVQLLRASYIFPLPVCETGVYWTMNCTPTPSFFASELRRIGRRRWQGMKRIANVIHRPSIACSSL